MRNYYLYYYFLCLLLPFFLAQPKAVKSAIAQNALHHQIDEYSAQIFPKFPSYSLRRDKRFLIVPLALGVGAVLYHGVRMWKKKNERKKMRRGQQQRRQQQQRMMRRRPNTYYGGRRTSTYYNNGRAMTSGRTNSYGRRAMTSGQMMRAGNGPRMGGGGKGGGQQQGMMPPAMNPTRPVDHLHNKGGGPPISTMNGQPAPNKQTLPMNNNPPPPNPMMPAAPTGGPTMTEAEKKALLQQQIVDTGVKRTMELTVATGKGPKETVEYMAELVKKDTSAFLTKLQDYLAGMLQGQSIMLAGTDTLALDEMVELAKFILGGGTLTSPLVDKVKKANAATKQLIATKLAEAIVVINTEFVPEPYRGEAIKKVDADILTKI